MSRKAKKGLGHKLGMIWVMTLFAATPVAMLWLDYGGAPSRWDHLALAPASALVGFSLIAVLFWLTQLVDVRVPQRWFSIRPAESVRFYRVLGVTVFRAVLLRSPFRTLNRDVHLTSRSRPGLLELKAAMQSAESNHLIALVLTLIATVAYGEINDPRFYVWLSAFNVVGNVYPILLQRYNRIRLERLLDRLPPVPIHSTS